MTPHTAHLLVSCPDAKGIVAAMTAFLSSHGANILDLDQHTDPDEGWFFARVAFDWSECDMSLEKLTGKWEAVATTHRMQWRIHDAGQRRRVAILVSKRDHCLRELLWRWEDGELACDVAAVISNHRDVEEIVRRSDVPFHYKPVSTATRQNQERDILAILDAQRIDLVVLARYMQILSPTIVEPFANRTINIHHSFLPAFAGSRPYHQAYEAGVKVIGATCHYVTETLDGGPIIEQAVVRVDHRDTVDDLIRKGADLERMALVKGVRLHLSDRVLVHGGRTVVFD